MDGEPEESGAAQQGKPEHEAAHENPAGSDSCLQECERTSAFSLLPAALLGAFCEHGNVAR